MRQHHPEHIRFSSAMTSGSFALRARLKPELPSKAERAIKKRERPSFASVMACTFVPPFVRPTSCPRSIDYKASRVAIILRGTLPTQSITINKDDPSQFSKIIIMFLAAAFLKIRRKPRHRLVHQPVRAITLPCYPVAFNLYILFIRGIDVPHINFMWPGAHQQPERSLSWVILFH